MIRKRMIIQEPLRGRRALDNEEFDNPDAVEKDQERREMGQAENVRSS